MSYYLCTEKKVELKCLICGSNSIRPNPSGYVNCKLLIDQGDRIVPSKVDADSICMDLRPFVCQNCGYVLWFNKDRQPKFKE